MKRNVTISLDEDTARWVRVEAAKWDMSVSQYLADLLAERRRRKEAYDSARSLFMARQARPLRRPDEPAPTRDELHRRTTRSG